MQTLPNLALIGVGNMGEALLRGLLAAGTLTPDRIVGAEKVETRAREVAARYGIRVETAVEAACRDAEAVILAVKPQDVDPALAAIRAAGGSPLVISICAGIPLARLEQGLGADAAAVRVMPNTPALVGAGASVYCANSRVTAEQAGWVEAILGAVGTVHRVEKEELLDTVTGLSGSGPAYAFAVIEALADGGVLMGLPRDLALHLAKQTVFGAAKLALESPEHPAVLRDRVTSPGGTTAAGLRELEARGLRSALIEAVRTATLRSRELGG
ncbi:MAG: pyrroline-5-carboxylate reductase [Candidatus Dadabacteria bacterium]|nr:MAG: pyrroline-5-carboxylate reductase [Candidatus Dadabacteria bacterium]